MKKIVFILIILLAFPLYANASEYIGIKAINDNNNNLRIGVDSRIQAIGFKAEQTAYITNVFIVFQASPGCDGYSCGDCGDIRVRILPSAGGSPPTPNMSGTVYSTGTHSFSCSNGECAPPESCRLVLYNMTTYYEVTEGTQYFIVIDNVDSNIAANYISTNSFNACKNANEPPVIDLDSQYDWFLLYSYNNGSSWQEHTYAFCESNLCKSGNAEITYSNGEYQGHVLYEPGNYSSYPFTVGTSGYFREQFQIQQDYQVRGAKFMGCAEGASSLYVTFQKNGVTQVTETVTETSDTCSTCGANASTTMDWHEIALGSDDYFGVKSGDTVEIVLTQASSTAWKITGGDDTGISSFENSDDVKLANYPYSSAQRYYSGAWRNVVYSAQTCMNCPFAIGHFRVNLLVEDAAAPILDSATIGTSGLWLTVGFSESCDVNQYQDGDFDLDCTIAGDNVALDYYSGDGSDTWVFSIDELIYATSEGESCTLDYAGRANGVEATDNAADLEAFSDESVTNSSAKTIPPTIHKSGSGIGFSN